MIPGEGGRKVKIIRRLRQTQVHFPDSNKTSTITKSNQVSLTNIKHQWKHLEEVRHALRDETPLKITLRLHCRISKLLIYAPEHVENVLRDVRKLYSDVLVSYIFYYEKNK